MSLLISYFQFQQVHIVLKLQINLHTLLFARHFAEKTVHKSVLPSDFYERPGKMTSMERVWRFRAVHS
jgi:hypothetical protein